MNAAGLTHTSETALRAAIAGRGNCTDDRADPEDWFLAHNEDEVSHVDSPARREVRERTTAPGPVFSCSIPVPASSAGK
ncbi:MAG: hypothetical protein H0V92_04240 [Pseudonocardiales bacterium]|nr:hypothetical protein [Pseudonocardiales bacterium]